MFVFCIPHQSSSAPSHPQHVQPAYSTFSPLLPPWLSIGLPLTMYSSNESPARLIVALTILSRLSVGLCSSCAFGFAGFLDNQSYVPTWTVPRAEPYTTVDTVLNDGYTIASYQGEEQSMPTYHLTKEEDRAHQQHYVLRSNTNWHRSLPNIHLHTRTTGSSCSLLS